MLASCVVTHTNTVTGSGQGNTALQQQRITDSHRTALLMVQAGVLVRVETIIQVISGAVVHKLCRFPLQQAFTRDSIQEICSSVRESQNIWANIVWNASKIT
jgi:hypothetical protein